MHAHVSCQPLASPTAVNGLKEIETAWGNRTLQESERLIFLIVDNPLTQYRLHRHLMRIEQDCDLEGHDVRIIVRYSQVRYFLHSTACGGLQPAGDSVFICVIRLQNTSPTTPNISNVCCCNQTGQAKHLRPPIGGRWGISE